jgi:hypothetical protein
VLKKRMPAAERRQENGNRTCRGLLPDGARITGRIAGLVPVPVRVLT